MDPMWIAAAFVCGAVSNKIGLPPLVGYLIAGFALNGLGVQGGETLEDIADLGVTLLLFTIGLKLKLKSLAAPQVWAGSTSHMAITVAAIWLGLLAFGAAGVPYLRALTGKTALLIAFALSFSSTVFAVKVFEGKREMPSRHAAVAIGILIMQDIVAVVFLAVAGGKMPSAWAPLLILSLFAFRPILAGFMARCGHGELLMLFGILMTAAGYGSFELVGLKGDLGALVFGVLLASHPKSPELAERLLGFKDLFLVGFFLSIGMSGSPTWAGLGIALLLVPAAALKALLFFGILTRFRLRSRTAMLASLSLANYSEFGLIVGSVGVAAGWIGTEWLIIIAISLALTFIAAAPPNTAAHGIYARLSHRLKPFETAARLPEDAPIETGDAVIGVIGMGRVGTAAFDEMKRRFGDVVMGMDFCGDTVERHRELGRNVIHGDADDSDFWDRFDLSNSRIQLLMLTLPNPEAGAFAVRRMRRLGYQGQIAASVRHEDEKEILRQAGTDVAYGFYEEAGSGFADHACQHMDHCRFQAAGPTS